jgi:16S rRNA C1402 (ribose-2'-O) methylase RsmI
VLVRGRKALVVEVVEGNCGKHLRVRVCVSAACLCVLASGVPLSSFSFYGFWYKWMDACMGA